MIQIAMTLALSVAIAVLALQSCSQTGARMAAAAGLAAYTEALRQYHQANCTQLPAALSEAQLRTAGWLQETLPSGTIWSAAFTSQGAMDVAVMGNNTAAAKRALATIASRTGGSYQAGQVAFTVTPAAHGSLSGPGFMRSQEPYPRQGCRRL